VSRISPPLASDPKLIVTARPPSVPRLPSLNVVSGLAPVTTSPAIDPELLSVPTRTFAVSAPELLRLGVPSPPPLSPTLPCVDTDVAPYTV
jgi:hypothetical protein